MNTIFLIALIIMSILLFGGMAVIWKAVNELTSVQKQIADAIREQTDVMTDDDLDDGDEWKRLLK